MPLPRFSRLDHLGNDVPLELSQWERLLEYNHESAVLRWEQALLNETEATPSDALSWPDSIHDGLAAAGKFMSRLGEERQKVTNEFSELCVEALEIDEEAFIGMSFLRGGQANFDELGWDWFCDLLRRNRRACGAGLQTVQSLKDRFDSATALVTKNRSTFIALGEAIDRVIWQLVGLQPDGSAVA